MSDWRDLSEVISAAPAKTLPINGEQVAFPARVSAWAGTVILTLTAEAEAARDSLGDDDPAEVVAERVSLSDEDVGALEDEILGSGRDDLDRLGVIGESRQHVMQTLMAWHMYGEHAARSVWESPSGKSRPVSRGTKRRTGGRSSVGSSRGTRGTGDSRTDAGDSSVADRRPTTRTHRGSRDTGH